MVLSNFKQPECYQIKPNYQQGPINAEAQAFARSLPLGNRGYQLLNPEPHSQLLP